MTHRRPLYLIFCILETARLALTVAALADTGMGPGASSPALPLAAAQALYPLMWLFLFLDENAYRNYRPLAMAGKVVSVAALGTWAATTYRAFLFSVSLSDYRMTFAFVSAAVAIVMDLAALLALALSGRDSGRRKGIAAVDEEGIRPPTEVVDVADELHGGAR